MPAETQPVQHWQAEQGRQPKTGQHCLQKLGDKNRPDGYRRSQQEIHIA